MKIDGHLHLMEHISTFCGQGACRSIGGGKVIIDTGEIIQMIPDGMGEYGYTYDSAIELMDAYSIDKAVLLQSSFYGIQNDYVIEAAQKYPGRFHPIAGVDPYCFRVNDILDNIVNHYRFKGIKFEISETGGITSYHPGFKVNGPEMQPIYELADEKALTLAFDLGGPAQTSYQVREMADVIKQYKNIRFVICHLLAIKSVDQPGWEDEMKLLAAENAWFDFAALSFNIREAYPYPSSIKNLERAANLVGTEKLVWGSDTPYVLSVDSYDALMSYAYESKKLTKSEVDKMFAANTIAAYDIV